MLDLIISTLTQGFIYALLSFGVYITYKILDFPDLTVDGSFPLGAAVTAGVILKGVKPGHKFSCRNGCFTCKGRKSVSCSFNIFSCRSSRRICHGIYPRPFEGTRPAFGYYNNDGFIFNKSADSRFESFNRA